MKKQLLIILSLALFLFTGLNPSSIVKAENTAHVITSDFATLAKQGKLKNFPLFLGMKKSDVIKIWGKPSSEQWLDTVYDPDPVLDEEPKCLKCKMPTSLFYDYRDVLRSISIPIKPIPIETLTKMLGKPLSISTYGSTFYKYKFGNYLVTFLHDEDSKVFTELVLQISIEALNANYAIKTLIDGKRIFYSDHPAILIQGKLYVPAPDIIEGLGGYVYWEENGVNGLLLNEKEVQLLNDSNVVKVNDKIVTLKSKPVRVKQRLLLPFEEYAKLLGIKYTWNPKTNILYLKS